MTRIPSKRQRVFDAVWLRFVTHNAPTPHLRSFVENGNCTPVGLLLGPIWNPAWERKSLEDILSASPQAQKALAGADIDFLNALETAYTQAAYGRTSMEISLISIAITYRLELPHDDSPATKH